MKIKQSRFWSRGFQYVILILVSFLSVFPFYWMIVSATNVSKDITMGRLSFGSALEANLTKLMKAGDLVTSLTNTVILTVCIVGLSLLLCSMAGYGYVVFQSKRKNRWFYFILTSMMIPTATLVIPLFRMFSKLGLLNTKLGVILPAVSTAFLIFFFRQNTKNFPMETIQAARIDGLNEAGIFFQIYFPMMKPTYAAATIITFMSAWNNYMWPLIALQTPDQRTLPLMISSLGSSYTPDFGMIMVGIIISTLPSALIFFLLQKHFVSGMVGSIK